MASVMPVAAAISAVIFSRRSAAVMAGLLNRYFKYLFSTIVKFYFREGSHAPDVVHGFCDARLDAACRRADAVVRDQRNRCRVRHLPQSSGQGGGDLADGGFISTQRGVGGGFTLARPPQSITPAGVRTLEGTSAGRMFSRRRRKLRIDAALPPKQTAQRARGLHARTRRHHAAECAYPPRAKKGSGPAASA